MTQDGRDTLCSKILEITALNVSRMEFVVRLAEAVTRFARVEHVDICVHDGRRHLCVTVHAVGSQVTAIQGYCGESVKAPCPAVSEGRLHCIRGALGCPRTVVVFRPEANGEVPLLSASIAPAVFGFGDGVATALVSPFAVSGKIDGVVALRSLRDDRFGSRDTELWANLAGLVGMAIAQ
ncbi:MAG: hypothetical protein WCJ30_22745, partial [Deltaproteobacteria bacterium]